MPGSTRSYEFGRRLARNGHDVQMLTTWRQKTDEHGWFTTDTEGMTVHWFPIRYDNSMGYAARLLAFLRFAWHSTRRACAIDADVIFATSTPLTIVIPALLTARWRGIPFVFEVRDMWPEVPIALGAIRNPITIAVARWLERRAYRSASHIVALAPGMAADIVAKGIPDARVSVVPNGCDLDLLGSASGTDVRTAHAWLGDRKLVIYAGAIGTANGVDYLAHVAAEVAAIDPEIRFVVFGTGAQCDSVESIARQHQILNRTFFMFPPVPKSELAAWLVAADLHTALMRGPRIYLKDAVNNKFFDAIAAGKPIANNFDGWQAEIAAEADVGVRLDPDNHRIAARELVKVLGDNHWLAAAGERARNLARSRFDRDLLADDIERILRNASTDKKTFP